MPRPSTTTLTLAVLLVGAAVGIGVATTARLTRRVAALEADRATDREEGGRFREDLLGGVKGNPVLGRNVRLRTPEGLLVRLDTAELRGGEVHVRGAVTNPLTVPFPNLELRFYATPPRRGEPPVVVRLGDLAPAARALFTVTFPGAAAPDGALPELRVIGSGPDYGHP